MFCEAPHIWEEDVPEATYHFDVACPAIRVFDKSYYIGDKINLCSKHAMIIYKEAREETKYSWM